MKREGGGDGTADRVLPGLLLLIASATCYGATPIFARIGYDGGTTALTVLSLRSLFAAILLVPALALLGRSFSLAAGARHAGIVIGILMAIMSYAYLGSIAFIPVSVSVLVFFSYPALAVLATRLLGLDAVGWTKGLAAAVAFGGLVLILGAEFGSGLDARGLGLAMLAAVTYAGMLLYSGRAARGADGLSLLFQSFAVCAAILLPISLAFGEFILPATTAGWVGLVGNATAFAIGAVFFFLGIGRVDPVRAAALSNIEPVVSIAAAVGVLGEVLSPVQVAGIVLVLGAVTLMGLSRSSGSSRASHKI